MRRWGVLVVALVSCTVAAREVDMTEAAVAARRFVELDPLFRGPRVAHQLGDCVTLTGGRDTLAYAFPLQPRGFVILLKDTRLNPVYAYSATARFSARDVPENGMLTLVRHDVAGRMQFIAALDGTRVAAPGTVTAMAAAEARWGELLADGPVTPGSARDIAQVGPLLTSFWGQTTDAYYSNDTTASPAFNFYTPLLPDTSEKAPTGCVSTALGQIMNYFEWPPQGVGAHSYHWSNGGQTLASDFGAHTYDWANILDDYTYPFQGAKSSTEPQREAVGRLLYDCGVAVETNYAAGILGGSSASNADIHYALYRYFQYDVGTYLDRIDDVSTDESFFAPIREHIAAGLPVVLGLPGHAVVADGVRQTDPDPEYYHINFGWQGSNNGWYDVSTTFWSGTTAADAEEPEMETPPNMGDDDPPPSPVGPWTGGADDVVLGLVPRILMQQPVGTTPDFTLNWTLAQNLAPQALALQETMLAGRTTTFHDDSAADYGYWETSAPLVVRQADSDGRMAWRAFLDGNASPFAPRFLTGTRVLGVTDATTMTFAYRMHYFDAQRARLQISSVAHPAWRDVVTYLGTGALDVWQTETVDLTNIAGVDYTGDAVTFRFEFTYYQPGQSYYLGDFPGFYVDEFTLENVEVYGEWQTVSDTLSGTWYPVTGKPVGDYAYRVRMKLLDEWRSWSAPVTVTVAPTGSVTCTLAPAGAVAAGARWRLTSGPDTDWHESGHTVSGLPLGEVEVTFLALDGWTAPTTETVTVVEGPAAVLTGTYTLLPPATPGSLTATAASSSAIDLEWTDESVNEDGFRVERGSGRADWMTLATLAADSTHYTDTQLAALTTYRYRVAAFNDAGATYSNDADATTLPLAGDGDGDGMDDQWEVDNFGDTSRDGTGDADADGVSDRREFELAGDPVNTALVLKPGWNCISIARVPVDRTVAGILGAHVSGTAWRLTAGRYEPTDSLHPTAGTWVYRDADTSVSVRLGDLAYPTEPDTDGDGFTDAQEAQNGTDPDRYALVLEPGWNVVSLARLPEDSSALGVFGDAGVRHCLHWDSGAFHTSVECSALRGEWVYVPRRSAVEIPISLP